MCASIIAHHSNHSHQSSKPEIPCYARNDTVHRRRDSHTTHLILKSFPNPSNPSSQPTLPYNQSIEV